MRHFLIGFGSAVAVSVAVMAQAMAGVAGPPPPDVSIQEQLLPGGTQAEYTVSIDSSNVPASWFMSLFAVGTNSNINTSITNGIGQWNSAIVSEQEWNNGYSFTYGTPGPDETLLNTLDLMYIYGLGNFGSIFGNASHANVYWAGFYTDFSIPGGSLIGPTETRGGFLYDTTLLTSNYVALVETAPGSRLDRRALTGSAVEVSESATLGLFGLGLIGLAAATRRRRQTA